MNSADPLHPQPNPQRKGLVPVLELLAASRTPLQVPAKRIDQVATELFTSLCDPS